jgi:DNA-binding transcriptional ArsR family regulator
VTAAAFAALGDPTRRRILELLADGEQPVGAVLAALTNERAISQPAVSQHLQLLRVAGLVTVRADGARRLYALDPTGLAIAAGWLSELAARPRPFAQPLDALATEVSRGRRATRRAAHAGTEAATG